MSELPPQVNAWLVIAVGIWLQALPFLLLGTIISATLTAVLTPRALARFLPRRTALAVPVAGLAGIALPACECASVPTTRSLVRAGVPTAAALTFMAASPAINPVVITATAIAYTVHPTMALARFVAGLLAAILIGLGWIWLGRPLRGVDDGSHGSATDADSCTTHDHTPQPRTVSAMGETFRSEFAHDFIQSCGFLVIGAAVAATIKVFVPTAWMQAMTSNVLLEAGVLSLLAVIVALCSEADAFMAVSLTSFSPTAQLAFLAIGPVVDVKLMAMEGGAFGAAFLRRFVPLAVGCCFVSALLVGTVMFPS
ncbi:permease [Cutibacterium equinum]|uniref:Permease n=1 Tax=Cutibacterium equinum TaxID=3016342 RepID=A0ABY7QZ46_9ACTN|nr:permease [Cutibacterium equinum]WCC79797.1 permease [Cutibacterium equinum]